jgi:hypothetical protein
MGQAAGIQGELSSGSSSSSSGSSAGAASTAQIPILNVIAGWFGRAHRAVMADLPQEGNSSVLTLDMGQVQTLIDNRPQTQTGITQGKAAETPVIIEEAASFLKTGGYLDAGRVK